NPYATDTMRQYATALLPVGTWAETAGTFVNAAGLWQSWNGVVPPVGESRPAWKVLRVLGNLFGVDGFEYEDIEQVREAVRASVADSGQSRRNGAERTAAPTNRGAKSAAPTGAAPTGGLEPIPGFGTYNGDMIVRRSPPL